jgi:hypothetical protein
LGISNEELVIVSNNSKKKKFTEWAALHGVQVGSAIAVDPDLADKEMTDEEFKNILNPKATPPIEEIL